MVVVAVVELDPAILTLPEVQVEAGLVVFLPHRHLLAQTELLLQAVVAVALVVHREEAVDLVVLV